MKETVKTLATCHVPPIDPRQALPSFRRFGASIGATPVPIGPAVRALCPEMLEQTHTHTHTHTRTHKHDPANFFSVTHRRKSSFIRTCYAKALAPFILYDFGLDAEIFVHKNRARCCLTLLRFSSIVSSSGGHPSKCRPGPVLLDFIFGCPVFRRSPIPPPTEPGAA